MKLILKNHQSPGDLVMLTAAVRDLHLNYPGQFETDVRTSCPALWENNPYITPLDEADETVKTIQCHYPLIHKSNQTPVHFIHGFIDYLNEQLVLNIRPTAFHGDIHISDAEKKMPSMVEQRLGIDLPFWIVSAGGKFDFTIKWWSPERFQKVVEHFTDKILFCQVGEGGHQHRSLHGTINLLGQTSLRELIVLMYHAQGVLTPVSLNMHLAAAVECRDKNITNRPCVVIAGGREPPNWEAYPQHQFIHMAGALACSQKGGCWKSRVVPLGDGDEKDNPEALCVDVVNDLPRCMDMITVDEVARRMQFYFDGGVLDYIDIASAEKRLNEVREEKRKGNQNSESTMPGEQPEKLRNSDESSENIVTREQVRSGSYQLSTANSAQIMDMVSSDLPDYPGGFSGRGIVMAAGGEKYFACAYICIRMLRYLGCKLPVEVWYLGKDEMSESMIRFLEPYGVKCIDAYEIRNSHPMRILNGWELKPYAATWSGFSEVLNLDADNVPVVDPTFLFDSDEFAEYGAMFWPDYGKLTRARHIWKLTGVEYRDEAEFETGQFMLNKERCWPALLLTCWMNSHSDYFYRYIHGDKDTFHLAWRKLNHPYFMMPFDIYSLEGVMCQHDMGGRRIFQHRNSHKWTLRGKNRKLTGFEYEVRCLGYLDEVREFLKKGT